jgi:hypothetical protein
MKEDNGNKIKFKIYLLRKVVEQFVETLCYNEEFGGFDSRVKRGWPERKADNLIAIYAPIV